MGNLPDLTVGASLLAKSVNDNACCLDARGVLWVFREQARAYKETVTDTGQFAVILAALLWSQYEFVAD